MASTINASTTGGGGIVQTADASGVLQLQTGGTAAVTVDASQNVGIGTASPASKLVVSGSESGTNPLSSTYGVRLNLINTNDALTGMGSAVSFQSASGTNPVYASIAGYMVGAAGSGAYGDIIFGTKPDYTTVSPTERMRITSSGNVLINTASYAGTQHKQVISNTSDYQLALVATDTTNGLATLTFGTGTATEAQMYYLKTNDRLFVVNSTAGVYLANNGTSWTSNSDERKKDIIEPIENGLEKVSTLRSVIGKYKADEEGTRRAFLIAQDVQAVLPEAVDSSDPDDLGVQYTDVIPLLVASIKELKAIVDTQAEQIKALEAK